MRRTISIERERDLWLGEKEGRSLVHTVEHWNSKHGPGRAYHRIVLKEKGLPNASATGDHYTHALRIALRVAKALETDVKGTQRERFNQRPSNYNELSGAE